ncbi:MAG: N-acetylneuraminate synthase [Lachnospiraceae bacterium]|nr:N-acetylneuraminate synthase [Lachnospiraceae bacterium]
MFQYKNITNKSTYVIAEIGANHNGDMELAYKLIDEAAKCGADCVKFQSWSKNTVFSKKTYDDNYFLADDYRNRTDYTLEEIVEEYSIDFKQHYLLKEYCKKSGIEFNSTPFSCAEVDLLVDELDVPFVKIASMDLNNLPFLKYIAGKKKPVVLSTGLGSLADIDDAVNCLETNGCDEIVLLHCTSIYPPQDEQVNLNNIDMLRDTFGYPTGYSDHTLGTLAPIMAIAKGACIIEKHFTLDKNMVGWDHKVSADTNDLEIIVEAARRGNEMLGSKRKLVVESQERREAFQRSIVAARDIPKDKIIEIEDLDYKRPGIGIPPKCFEFVVGKKAQRDIKYDEIINMEDF